MGIFNSFIDGINKKHDELMVSLETNLRVERMKNDVKSLRKEKDEMLRKVAMEVYRLFSNGELKDPVLLPLCQAVQMKQWEIDEKWAEINRVTSEDH